MRWRIRYTLAKWLVPEVKDVLVLKTEVAQWQEYAGQAETLVGELEREKDVLLAQVAALKKSSDDSSVKFEFVSRMADKFYVDLVQAKQEFIEFLTRQPEAPKYEDTMPAMLHPDDIMVRIAQIQADAESMYGDV